MFNKITAALDGSESSIKALQYAAHLANQDKAELQIISVIEPLSAAYAGGSTSAYNEVHLEVTKQQYQKIQQEQTTKLTKQYPDLKITTIIREGRPSTEISQAAEDSDLIVIGHRGHGGILSWMLGSVAKQIVDNCTASVLIIKNPDYCNA
ncbi:universal stress protein [Candidatus Bathyarchaeota archaeon]|nr:MAG: universal stress protein [Candidatus Bathyarchaeota archaeon]